MRPFTKTALFYVINIVAYTHHGSCHEFTGQNLALGMPAWQYPGTHYHGKADLAVDGDTNSDYSQGLSCTHTTDKSMKPSAYWTVDLGNEFYISGVRIYNRKNVRERLRRFRLYGQPGNVTLYDDAVQIYPQYKMSIINVTIDSTQPYRNITVFLPTVEGEETVLTLCEVEVYGGCLVPSITNVSFSKNQNGVVTSGTEIQASCSVGFKLENTDITLICSHNYTWIRPMLFQGEREPFCTAVLCRHPGKICKGYYIQNNKVLQENEIMAYNSTIEAVCMKGYTLISDQSIYRTCSEQGNWTGISPDCEPTNSNVDKESALESGLIGSITTNGILVLLVVVLLVSLVYLKKRYSKSANQSKMYMDLAVRPETSMETDYMNV